MDVRFGNPNINIGDGLSSEIEGILLGGWVSIGKYVEALENSFKVRYRMKYAIACSSATTGLIIAIKAAGWKGRNVHFPSFTWPSTLYAINCNRNAAIAHDIDCDTWFLNKEIKKTLPCDCVVPVDIFGSEADIYDDFPKENRIYDAAHGYGLPNLGKRGIAEVVSLSFTKVVTSMEGGIILTDDDELAGIATELRRLSGRMGEINALIALRSVSDYTPDHTKSIISYYKKYITVPHKCQIIPNDTNNSVFSILFKDSAVRDAIRIALEKEGIETKVYYDPLFKGYPVTEDIYSRILSLPTHCEVPHDKVIETVNSAGRRAGTPGKEFVTQ